MGLLIQNKRTRSYKNLLLPLALLLLWTNYVLGQNVNTPNKTGPMGLQVNTLTGNLFFMRNDVTVPARAFDLSVSFSYNSYNYDQNVGFGNGWSLNYCIRYRNDTSGAKTIIWGDGREDTYTPAAGNSFKAPSGIFSKLSEYQTNKFLLRTVNGIKFYFDNPQHRKVTRIEEPNGNFLNFVYTDSLLLSVSNPAGQAITFGYSDGKLKTVTDANASPTRIYSYAYDAAGNLTEATNPLGYKNKYTYLVNGPIKSVADKNNNVVNVIYYNDFSVRELIGCNKRVSFSYDPATLTSYVTDHLLSGNNQVTKYEYVKHGDRAWLAKQSGNCCGSNMSFEYDDAGNVIKLTDANGNVYRSTYDDRGNILTITDPLNQVLSYTYSAEFNQVLSSKDPSGNVHTLSYDSKGNLIKVVEPGGLTTTMTYSSAGDVIAVTDPKGNTENYVYDAYGYLSTLTAPLGFTMGFAYDARGNLLSVTDARGFSYTLEYDNLNRLKKLSNPINGITQFNYDQENNLTSVTNPKGHSQFFSYDASNRIVTVTNALGHKRFMVYDEMNNVTQLRNALGHVVNLTYDSRNRLSSLTNPAGSTVQFSYDPNGNLTTVSYPTGRTVKHAYDALNRLIKSEDEDGLLGELVYDKNGNITSFKNATGAVATYSYDALDRLIKATDVLGNQKTFQYDNNSNTVSMTDRNGKTRNYAYDALNRLVSYTDGNGFSTNMAYDVAGNLVSLTDAKNNTTTYSYDNLHRLTRATFPDGKFTEIGYDAIGNMLTKKLPDGNTIQYQYDSLNRLVSKTLPGGDHFTFGYDALSRLVSCVNNHSSLSFSYDALSRRTSENLNGRVTRYSYDNLSLVRNIIYPDSTVVTKTYDKRHRLTNVSKGNVPLATYGYNTANQLTQIVLGNQVTTQLQYDFANRLNSLSTNNGNIQHYVLGYDNERNVTAISRLNNPTLSEEFTYDAGYRLTNYKRGASGAPNLQQTYTYDPLGNRTSANLGGSNVNYSTNNLNQLVSSSGSQNTNFVYDDNGNLTFDGIYHKKYDAERRLLLDSASPANKINYVYDALGRRLRKTVNGMPIEYSYAGLTQIEQRDGNTDTLVNRIIPSGFLNPICLEKNNNRYFYHRNHLGSVEAISNGSGSVVEKYSYDPYGNMQISDANGNNLGSSQVGNNIGFAGQQYDERGNLTFQFRQYSPKTGTFHQRDQLGYTDGMNMYQYVGNNPASKTDPLGLLGMDDAFDLGPGMDADFINNAREEFANSQAEGGSELYHGSKNVKDALSMLSGLDRYNLLKMMENQPQWVKDMVGKDGLEKGVKDWMTKYDKLNQFLNNPWTQRAVIGLKFISLPEKYYKIWHEWHCGILKTFINTSDAGLSTTSLLYSLGKFNKWKYFRSSPNWLVWYSVLDITSKTTTGKSVLTNVADLPFNVYELEKMAWEAAGMHNRIGSLDDLMTGQIGFGPSPISEYHRMMPYGK